MALANRISASSESIFGQPVSRGWVPGTPTSTLPGPNGCVALCGASHSIGVVYCVVRFHHHEKTSAQTINLHTDNAMRPDMPENLWPDRPVMFFVSGDKSSII